LQVSSVPRRFSTSHAALDAANRLLDRFDVIDARNAAQRARHRVWRAIDARLSRTPSSMLGELSSAIVGAVNAQ